MICTVNPAIEDDSLELKPDMKNVQNIVIVGGGPAGLESARVSANHGHNVTLLESADTLGGKVLLTSNAKERPHYDLHIKWLAQEVDKLGVNVFKNFKADVDDILSFKPDKVVIANGATQYNPYTNRSNIFTEAQILRGDIEINKNKSVIIYDREGVYRGASLALYIAEKGAESIEIATPHWSVCDNLDDMRKAELYKLLGKNKIHLSANKKLIFTSANQLTLKDTFTDEQRNIQEDDFIVLVGFEEGENTLYENLLKTTPEVKLYQVGDSVSPRRLHDAIREGAKAAYSIQ